MSEDLDSFSFEHYDLETCKKYCYNGDVIVERIPRVHGFEIKVIWHKADRMLMFSRRFQMANFGRLHFYWGPVYMHESGEIVYKPSDNH